MSSSWRPLPSSMPTERLRESEPVQVRTRSPRPESRPVSGGGPAGYGKRVISAIPRVMRAAEELWPRLRPVTTPAASAMTFFRFAQLYAATSSLV